MAERDTHPVAPDATADGVDPRPGSTLVVGVISVLITALALILLQSLFYRTAEAEDLRKAVGRSAEVRRLQDEQRARLEGYRWVDREHGVVAIPIERATELLLQEQGARREKR